MPKRFYFVVVLLFFSAIVYISAASAALFTITPAKSVSLSMSVAYNWSSAQKPARYVPELGYYVNPGSISFSCSGNAGNYLGGAKKSLTILEWWPEYAPNNRNTTRLSGWSFGPLSFTHFGITYFAQGPRFIHIRLFNNALQAAERKIWLFVDTVRPNAPVLSFPNAIRNPETGVWVYPVTYGFGTEINVHVDNIRSDPYPSSLILLSEVYFYSYVNGPDKPPQYWDARHEVWSAERVAAFAGNTSDAFYYQWPKSMGSAMVYKGIVEDRPVYIEAVTTDNGGNVSDTTTGSFVYTRIPLVTPERNSSFTAPLIYWDKDLEQVQTVRTNQ